MQRTLHHWLTGIRAYIAMFSVLVTALVVWWARSMYGDSPTATIRMQEIFAWLAVGLIVLAVSIGPVFKLFDELPGRRLWFESRRMIGISAAWFSVLHVGIAYIVQFKLANPLSLPSNYQAAFGIGGIALIILLAMAFTSFDKAFQRLGIWWFRLHRLVYVVLVALVLHIFIIGSHGAQFGVIVGIGLTAVFILVVHTALVIHTVHSHKPARLQVVSVVSFALLMAVVITYGFHQRTVHGLIMRSYGVTQK